MADAISKTRRQKVEEKERAILAATRAAFRNNGPEQGKISAIAQAANLAEGTLYLYFRNKQALLMAAVSDFYGELTQDAEAAVASTQDTESRLAALARLHFGRVREEWPLIAEAMGPHLASSEYRATEAYALNRRYVAVFDGVIRDGIARGGIRTDVSVSAMRDTFYGGLEHAARSARLRAVPPDADTEVAQFLTVFTSGIMDRPAGSEVDARGLVRSLKRIIAEYEEQLRSGAKGGQLTRHEETPE